MIKPKIEGAPPKIKGETAKKRRTRGSNKYTYVEKGACLAILEFFNGDYSRAARVIGISPITLKTYHRQLTEGQDEFCTAQVRDISVNGIIDTFMRLFEVSCALTLARSPLASISQMISMISAVGDKIVALQAVVARAPVAATPPSTAAQPESAVPEDTVPVLDEAERQKWENFVETIMTESAVTRAQAIKILVTDKPEAKEYLKRASSSLDDLETEGGIS